MLSCYQARLDSTTLQKQWLVITEDGEITVKTIWDYVPAQFQQVEMMIC